MDERKIIEKNLASKGSTTAIYSCSYYLFIHKEPPTDSFRTDIWKELRTTLTGDSYFNVLKRLVNIDTTIMSSAEFLELPIEIYDFQIDVNPEGNFRILKLKIFDFDKVRKLQRQAVSERMIELENVLFIKSWILLLLLVLTLLFISVHILISKKSFGVMGLLISKTLFGVMGLGLGLGLVNLLIPKTRKV